YFVCAHPQIPAKRLRFSGTAIVALISRLPGFSARSGASARDIRIVRFDHTAFGLTYSIKVSFFERVAVLCVIP
ncbi:MAG: hypothetical protein VX411_03880, partial [Pseudomonadota bacterium]|nr:hypothetical protein [Pseudomonadota bacterium]